MTIDLQQLFLLGLLSASIHWLVARSEVGRVIWENARGGFDRLLRCAGCSGWWLGVGLGIAGLRPFTLHWRWTAIVFTGLLSVILTPIFEGALLWGLRESMMEREEHMPLDEDTAPLERPIPPQSSTR